MFNLPLDFISTITNTFGADGEQFLATLPELIDEASQRWGLTNVQPLSELSYNFVAFAESSIFTAKNAKIAMKKLNLRALRVLGGSENQGDVVLKIGIPREELTSEIAALRLFNGEGACQLIDADEDKGFLLLERLKPGAMLSTLEDDEEATRIAAEAMRRIWKPLDLVTLSPEGAKSLPDDARDPSLALRVTFDKFILLSDWFNGLKRLRKMFNGGTGPLDGKLVARVESSVKDFFAENHMPVLMHGDFHHFNILSSERGWLVIDPKGVIGPACYEIGPLMMNPWGELPRSTSLKVRVKRRVDILHEQLGFEHERIVEWSLAHSILSAWWSIEDHGDWHYAANLAELIADL
jgi:streptomycin 6-kinase